MVKSNLPRSRSQSAQGMVEFALVLPVLLMLTLGIMEVGRLLAFYTAAVSASREGARVGSAAGTNELNIFHYQNCNRIREEALRVGFFAGMRQTDIQIHYDNGPDFEASPFGSCPINSLGPAELDLGDRIVVTTNAVWSPIVPIVPLQPVNLTSTSRRTILKNVGVEGPAPDDRLPKVSFHEYELEDCQEQLACERVIYVMLNESWPDPVYVNFYVYGSAIRGQDYTVTPSSLRVEIPATQLSATIKINVINDTLYEDPEMVMVVMGSIINGQPSTPNFSYFTIINDDPPPVVSFFEAEQSLDEGHFGITPVNVRARLNTLSGKPVTVAFDVIGGTATLEEDYVVASGYIVIPAGSIVSAITTQHIHILGDYTYEEDETIRLQLHSPIAATLDPNPLGLIHTVRILNDDTRPAVFFLPEAQSASEEVGELVVEVWLSISSGLDVPVHYTIGGTATRNVDYTITPPSPVIVPAGEVSVPITITLVQDGDLTEANETIVLTIVDVGEDAMIGEPDQHIATITSEAVLPTIWFAPHTQTVSEGVGRIYARVRLSAPYTDTISVPYTFSGTALPEVDYTNLTPALLEIPAGVITHHFILEIVDDKIYETSETIRISMGEPVNAIRGNPYVHTVTILDNEPPPYVFFTLGGHAVIEDVVTTTVRVELNTLVYQDVSVPFTIDPASTATLGSDYTVSASPLLIPAGSIGADIVITVIDDLVLNEPNETVILKLGLPINADKGSPDTHILEIIDNDACPTLSTLQIGGSKMNATINHTSLGARDVTIEEAVITWVTAPGQSMRGIFYDNNQVFKGNSNSSPSVIPSGNLDWIAGSNRLVPAGASTKQFEVQFKDALAIGSYSLRLRFSNGCSVVLTNNR
jgi:hypothetical protein